MKRRGLVGRLAVVALVLCLVTMSLTAGTLAKYASETTGAATATVAKWKVDFKDGDNEFTSTSKIALKPDQEKFVDKNLVAADKVAPEITGSVALSVDGSETEVAFDYTVALNVGEVKLGEEDATDFPLKFYTDKECTQEIEPAEGIVSVTGTVLANASEEEKKPTTTIYWKWTRDEADDTADTTLGTASAADSGPVVFTIPVTIKAEQKTST